jgi:molybdenum-dependent DNA-binding transcriptional regulator ModE
LECRFKKLEKMDVEIYYDVRFSNEGKVFDENCFRILCAVEETGSLNRAAKEVHLTYCVALKIMKKSKRTWLCPP